MRSSAGQDAEDTDVTKTLAETRPISFEESPFIPPVEEPTAKKERSAQEIADAILQAEELRASEEVGNLEIFEEEPVAEPVIEEVQPQAEENPDHILQNVLGQLRMQSTGSSEEEPLSTEEQKIFDQFVSEMESEAPKEQAAEITEESLLDESIEAITTEAVLDREVETEDIIEEETGELPSDIEEILEEHQEEEFTLENIQGASGRIG